MIRLIETPADLLPSRRGVSWCWSWVASFGTTIGVAFYGDTRMLLLCWRRP